MTSVKTPRTRAKLHDVANAAGVSIATASRALNGSRPVEKAIADRVHEAAARLSYAGNYHHRSIRLGRAEALGFAHQVPHTWQNGLPGGYFAAVIAGVDAAAREVGYVLTVFSPDRQHSALERAMAAIENKRIDALVVAGEIEAIFESPLLGRAKQAPVVLTHPRNRVDVPSVRRDEVRGVELAVEHLLSLGHRRVLWLGWASDQGGEWPSRQQVFVEAAWRSGVQGDVCVINSPDDAREPPTETVLQVAQQVVEARFRDDPTGFSAIVAYNDVLAIAASRGVRAAGLAVPDDVSIIGFDNNVSMLASPPLTSVDMGFFELGRRAGQIALDRSRGESSDGSPLTALVEPRLVVRESTAPVPKMSP